MPSSVDGLALCLLIQILSLFLLSIFVRYLWNEHMCAFFSTATRVTTWNALGLVFFVRVCHHLTRSPTEQVMCVD